MIRTGLHIALFFLLGTGVLMAQHFSISGKVVNGKGEALEGIEIMLEPIGDIAESDSKGNYLFKDLNPDQYKLITYADSSGVIWKIVDLREESVVVDFELAHPNYTLGTVVIADQEEKTDIDYLRSIEGTAIYAGKKTKVIRPSEVTGNLATNNGRQIYAKVSGLNIWESDGAGLQLGIGGRGLSPNRTANFNTRQNGYDISADALGYPESYYSPPIEAVEKIQIVRGAASLQFGPQFGGMVNFVMKEGPRDKKVEATIRNSFGSFGFFNSFTSVGGTMGKVNYYTFLQIKRGNGWRPNSDFWSLTGYAGLRFNPTEKLTLRADYTFMNYRAQQAGGLTDAAFAEDPRQSLRERNWFQVQWNLMSLSMDYDFTKNAKLNWRNFGLVAHREALGVLNFINRPDPMTERSLLTGNFLNFGSELRFLQKYTLLGNPSAFLVGARYYQGSNVSQQGSANAGEGPDFEFLEPGQPDFSDYSFPSRNVSVFAENIFNLTPKFSVTPGARFEYIQTAYEGSYQQIARDLAGNIILEQTVSESDGSNRAFALLGLGVSYKHAQFFEAYANFSQNYRSINFNDLRTLNQNLSVSEDLRDERGYNADLGFRGTLSDIFHYDLSLFMLYYKDRIGVIWKEGTLDRIRTNVSDSRNMGVESLVEVDLIRAIRRKPSATKLSLFSNVAFIHARYINSDNAAIDGNHVELAPPVNLKSGLALKWKALRATAQVTYVSKQYSDATNAEITPTAVDGAIPAYYVMDLAMSYTYRWFKIEASLNNVTNNMYFTRRASGYPGPGIIPADGRSFYLTLQVKI